MSHSVILLQIVMVSPKLKMLGPLCIQTGLQTVNLKTDSETLYNSPKINLESFYFKGQQRLKKTCLV